MAFGTRNLFGMVWLGTACVFFATTFRREGYQAAIDDLADADNSNDRFWP
jgi:hypothetical protein